VEDLPGRSTLVADGVRVTGARAGRFAVHELAFPGRYAQHVEPPEGYVALVLEGGVEKTFARRTRAFRPGGGLTVPAGATHGARFTPAATRIVTVRAAPGAPADPMTAVLGDVRDVRGAACAVLGWRLAAELRACDDAWTLAAEGLCLELVAALLRGRAEPRESATPRWLDGVRERLHARFDEPVTLAELAADAGVHPAHLARAFRRRYGMGAGEYVRRTRLAWAAAQLASTDTPLAVVAAEAGFADQSHFTRAFKRHTGLTPGRYRRVVRS
jgi:AraC family transcriptional regulator